jgi:4-hydroxybenzoate polyprenyltransferase
MTTNDGMPGPVVTPGALALTSRAGAVRGLLRSMRPKQWTKNGLLFVGLIFSFNLPNARLFLVACLAFAVFCALSSATYLINDVMDVEKDRSHPKKRFRPIAAGIVSPGLALVTAAGLTVIAVPVAFAINPTFGLLALTYLAITLAYTFVLKHIVIVDVFALASGFVIRAVAGGAAVVVPVSPWLYVCTILGALFVGIGKRRHELALLQEEANNHRPILQEYSAELLDQMMAVVTPAIVMAYSLYTFSAPNLPANHAMMLTIPFVLYGVFRYLYLVHVHGEGGSPEDLLLRDRALLVDIVLWLVSAVVILYLGR